jgi:NAD(P)-dependent dehydrogenase (short-subunit alcohol dehydrogenase family)
MRIKDKVAIVTGGGGGIGQATCRLLAREGGKIMIADVVAGEAEKLAASIRGEGGDADVAVVDITKYEAAISLSEATMKRYGRIDILVNLAGGSAGPAIRTKQQIFAQSTPDRWEEMLTLNLVGTLNATRAVVNQMIEQKSGRIVSFSSSAGVIGGMRVADYSAAKAGVIGFTKALAKEVAPYGINVNSIAPGVVGTPRMMAMAPEIMEGYLKGIRLRRFARPEELASVVLFLVADDSSYITGQNIEVDGGLNLGPENY